MARTKGTAKAAPGTAAQKLKAAQEKERKKLEQEKLEKDPGNFMGRSADPFGTTVDPLKTNTDPFKSDTQSENTADGKIQIKEEPMDEADDAEALDWFFKSPHPNHPNSQKRMQQRMDQFAPSQQQTGFDDAYVPKAAPGTAAQKLKAAQEKERKKIEQEKLEKDLGNFMGRSADPFGTTVDPLKTNTDPFKSDTQSENKADGNIQIKEEPVDEGDDAEALDWSFRSPHPSHPNSQTRMQQRMDQFASSQQQTGFDDAYVPKDGENFETEFDAEMYGDSGDVNNNGISQTDSEHAAALAADKKAKQKARAVQERMRMDLMVTRAHEMRTAKMDVSQRRAAQLENYIKKSQIRRLARTGGVKRIGRGLYPFMQGAIQEFVNKVLYHSSMNAVHARRKTVEPKDVTRALQTIGKRS